MVQTWFLKSRKKRAVVFHENDQISIRNTNILRFKIGNLRGGLGNPLRILHRNVKNSEIPIRKMFF